MELGMDCGKSIATKFFGTHKNVIIAEVLVFLMSKDSVLFGKFIVEV
jgi:hypothetical protein